MSQQASTSATPTTADNRPKFGDVTCELNIGMELLIKRLEDAFDAGFELDTKISSDVMDAIISAQWVAQRLSDDIHTLGLEFDGTRSDEEGVKFAQAAE
jgi:hypothetical protein